MIADSNVKVQVILRLRQADRGTKARIGGETERTPEPVIPCG